ncbi:hypothetical protein PMIN05_009498 [Paraphaeosphaeria minitans]
MQKILKGGTFFKMYPGFRFAFEEGKNQGALRNHPPLSATEVAKYSKRVNIKDMSSDWGIVDDLVVLSTPYCIRNVFNKFKFSLIATGKKHSTDGKF